MMKKKLKRKIECVEMLSLFAADLMITYKKGGELKDAIDSDKEFLAEDPDMLLIALKFAKVSEQFLEMWEEFKSGGDVG